MMTMRRLVGDELLENVREMFEDSPDPDPIDNIALAIFEGSNEEECAEREDVKEACDKLVASGHLRRLKGEVYCAGPKILAWRQERYGDMYDDEEFAPYTGEDV